MKLKTKPYLTYENDLPPSGNHIVAQQEEDNLIVYQAFNPHIARYAVEHQQFGGPNYSFNRMSWIKPNFLWMMYRCGWALKENQQRVLAIKISKTFFTKILSAAVHSSFKKNVYETAEAWRDKLQHSNVRLQWDPDHDPYGNKLERRAIQLGLKGDILHEFGKEQVLSIEDITPFVHEQGALVMAKDLQNLMVLEESVLPVKDEELKRRLLISNWA